MAASGELELGARRLWDDTLTSMRSISARRLLLAIILLQLGVLYFLLRNNSWVFDDNFFLVLAGQEGFTWHWLTSVQFEHWDIGENALISLQHRLFFLDYRWALLFMLGLLGASIYLFERTLAMIVRNRWITIAFAGWFGLSVLWVRPLQWWAAGVQYFPYTLFDLLCLYGFIRYHASGSRRWLAVSAVALAVALLFYEKPAYMLIYLVLMRVFLMSENLRPGAVLRCFWRERFVWITYLAVIAVWAAGYIHAHAYGTHGYVSPGQYLTYFRIFWLETLVPSMASVTIPAFKLSAVQILFVVASQAAVLACVVISLRRKRAAWRAWTFLAIIILADVILVAHSRVAQFGVGIANDPRYLIDFSWLVPLALCVVFSRTKVLRPVISDSDARLTLPSAAALAPALAGAALVAYAGGSVATAAQLQRDWPGSRARTWEQNLRRSFAQLGRSSKRFVIADNATPFEIMEPFVAPYNRLSRVLKMYVGPTQVDGPLDAPLALVSINGIVRGARLQPVADSDAPIDELRSGQVQIRGGRQVPLGKEICVIADGSPVQVERRLSTPPNTGDAPYYLRLAYHAWQSLALPVYVDSGAGFTGAPENSITLRSGVGTSIAWLGPNPPHNLLIQIPPLTTVCLERVGILTVRNSS
jgi:hypothetical protein